MINKSEKRKFGGNATIEHQLKTTKTNTGLKLLTQHAVLDSLDDKKHSKAPIYRARALQKQLPISNVALDYRASYSQVRRHLFHELPANGILCSA